MNRRWQWYSECIGIALYVVVMDVRMVVRVVGMMWLRDLWRL